MPELLCSELALELAYLASPGFWMPTNGLFIHCCSHVFKINHGREIGLIIGAWFFHLSCSIA